MKKLLAKLYRCLFVWESEEEPKQITEWFQLSYTESGCTSAIIKEDFDDALRWCREQLYTKDTIHLYHHKDNSTKLLLTIKWEM